ncbi:MAG TPA: Uma2 family endonuclease [Gemmatimonadaceae bacterium]|nr:Uma2 family endonuclease [Gemmatimonadaceae bacterium]
MPAFRRQWTVDDLLDLPDDGQRYEVIDGELFVTPAPSIMHQRALGVLFRLIADYLDRERVGYVYFAPADVIFSPKRGVQPDLLVLPGIAGRSPRSFDEVKRLLLAVEVLSPSTARLDRVVKRALYRDEGVPEFWIVDLESRTFERSTPADSRVEVLDERIEWMPAGASAPLVIDIVRYFENVLEA